MEAVLRNKQEESEREKKRIDDKIIIEINDDNIPHPNCTSLLFLYTGNRSEEAEKKSNDHIVIEIKDDSENAEKMCRICYEPSESSQIIKLGCDCKGEIEFAHRMCASKWFSHKGNMVCEICGKNVDSNNVTLTSTRSEMVEFVLTLVNLTGCVFMLYFGIYDTGNS